MEPIDLNSIKRFTIQSAILAELAACLEKGRKHGIEALALLAGFPVSESEFMIDTCYVPAQRATAISVELDEGSLLPIHEDLVTSERALAIQVHSHPGTAYHSDEDDADTTVTQSGSLSIVVPEFGALGLDGWPGCAIYRRFGNGWSRPMSKKKIQELLDVDDE